MIYIKLWAKRAWVLDCDFAGTMSGGIDPPKQLISCEVTAPDTVEISYDYPETCGLSDVRYHVIDPHKVRKDVFNFTKDGSVMMNGEIFPGVDRETDPWTESEAKKFIEEFRTAFRRAKKIELMAGTKV